MDKDTIGIERLNQRILKREDNLYKKEIVTVVTRMYMEELRKALVDGEKVNLKGVGIFTPKISQPRSIYNLPQCNNIDGVNLPYTSVKYRENSQLKKDMNSRLRANIRKGKLELSEGRPAVKYISAEWGKWCDEIADKA